MTLLPQKKRSLVFAGVIALLLCGCQSSVKPLETPADLFREVGYEDALNLSRTESKPLFLFFDGDWAKDRQKLVSRVLANPSVAPLLRDRTVALRIEVVDLPDIAKSYRVTSVPQLLLIATDGREINRWASTPKADAFAAELSAMLSGSSAIQYQRDSLKSSDLVARHKLADRLIADGQHAEALQELLWLYEHGIGANAFAKKDLSASTVIKSLGVLKAHYAPAADVLVDLCEREKQNALRSPDDTIAGRKLAEILRVLQEDESSLSLYRSLHPGKAREKVRDIVVIPNFVTQHDYRSAASELPINQALREVESIKELNMFGRGLTRTLLSPLVGTQKISLLFAREQLHMLQKRAFYFEIYAGADRVDEARQIASVILKADRLKQAPAVLRASAQKACGKGTDAFLQKIALPELLAIPAESDKK
jgi:hypothetical protein